LLASDLTFKFIKDGLINGVNFETGQLEVLISEHHSLDKLQSLVVRGPNIDNVVLAVIRVLQSLVGLSNHY